MKTNQIRLRRKIEHEEIEMNDNNESPIACVDCDKRYPLTVGTSNCRCAWCHSRYKSTLGGFSSQLAQSRSK